jgi:hypothetical protein
LNLNNKNKEIRILILALLVGALLLSACNFTASGTPNLETATPNGQKSSSGSDAHTSQDITAPTIASPSNTGTEVNFGALTLDVPTAVADGASGSEIPRFDSEDAAWWQKTPGHLEIMLGDYYVLQGKFHRPQIYVYPAQGYAELVPPAFESIHRLNNILATPNASFSIEQVPGVPFFNAQAVFVSNIEVISFQNGSGIRFLTQYDQYNAPVNNYELFYHFQGVTNDGAYYIIAILPVTTQLLAETSDPAAAVPPNGVTYPDINDIHADWKGYYAAITDLLNATPGDYFTPTLGQLDALINSMVICLP